MTSELPSLSRGNILVVDDTPANLRLLTDLLTKEGYEVRPVPNGKLAISGAQAIPPDLVLLDIRMPEMDGYEVCQQLKADEKTRDIPVIFISALDDLIDKVKGFSSGGVDYITKPFQAEEVIARIHTHLELKFNREALKTSYEVIKKQQEQAEIDLIQARETQLALFPSQLPQIPQVQLICKYLPIQKIGGDFYDVFELGHGKYGLVVGDVTGHGIPAALVSFLIYGIFKDAAQENNSTQLILYKINQALYGRIPTMKFATLFYGIYDSRRHTISYTNAGHPPGLVIREATQTLFELRTKGILVGAFTNEECQFEEKEFQFLPGDKLLLYTDGLFEIINEEEQFFGMNRLLNFLKAHCHLPITELMDQLFDHSLAYVKQNSLGDDCTMIGLEIDT